MKNAPRCALYVRVSTQDQNLDNQRPDLLQLAKAMGFEIAAVYEEKASAVKTRPAFNRLMLDAYRGAFDVLVMWAIDRLGRSMSGNLATIVELDRIGVQVVSVRESWLDTGGPVRSLLVAIFSWVAEQERARIVERTKAGLERARREGKRIGRPRADVDLERALRLRGQGRSVRQIGRALGLGASTVHRALVTHDASLIPSLRGRQEDAGAPVTNPSIAAEITVVTGSPRDGGFGTVSPSPS
jgi:putative DNA-invertase from lambdoid prophage Rac